MYKMSVFKIKSVADVNPSPIIWLGWAQNKNGTTVLRFLRIGLEPASAFAGVDPPLKIMNGPN